MELILDEIAKSFGSKLVLRSLTLRATAGMCIGVVGKNGAGKSTLFNILANLVLPSSGTIALDGHTVTTDYPLALKKRIGALLTSTALVEEFTAREYLTYIAAIYQVVDYERKIDDLLRLFFTASEPLGTVRLQAFSAGMRQKIRICSCLLHKPDLLILDEPFTALDFGAAQTLVEIVTRYTKQALLLISSHDLTYLEQTATHLLILDEQQVKYWGTVEEFRLTQPLSAALMQQFAPKSEKVDEVQWLVS